MVSLTMSKKLDTPRHTALSLSLSTSILKRSERVHGTLFDGVQDALVSNVGHLALFGERHIKISSVPSQRDQ